MDLEQTIMSLIVFGGNAKSDAMLAIDSAKKGISLKQTNKSPKQNKHYLKRIILKQNLYKVKHVAKNRSFPSTRSRTRPLNECNYFQRFSERNC